MKTFTKGSFFAWGSSIYEAVGDCEVHASVYTGDAAELLVFDDECPEETAVKVAEAIGADTTFMMIGSTTGEDEDAPDYEDD